MKGDVPNLGSVRGAPAATPTATEVEGLLRDFENTLSAALFLALTDCSYGGNVIETRADSKRRAKTLRDELAASLRRLSSPTPTAMRPLPDHDNHHNALRCPYCNPNGRLVDLWVEPTAPERELVERLIHAAKREREADGKSELDRRYWSGRVSGLEDALSASAPPAAGQAAPCHWCREWGDCKSVGYCKHNDSLTVTAPRREDARDAERETLLTMYRDELTAAAGYSRMNVMGEPLEVCRIRAEGYERKAERVNAALRSAPKGASAPDLGATGEKAGE